MFGIDLPELLVVLAVAVVAIGPKDMPRALYMLGKTVRNIKKLGSGLQKSIDEIMHEEELSEIIRDANAPHLAKDKEDDTAS